MTTHNWAFSRINKRQINVNCLGHDMTHHAATTIFNLGNKQISSVCLSFDSSTPAKINEGYRKTKLHKPEITRLLYCVSKFEIYVKFLQNFYVEKLNCSSHIYISSLYKGTTLCFSQKEIFPFVQQRKVQNFKLYSCFIIFYLKYLGSTWNTF